MRHGVKNKKLGVNSEHKRAILRSLTTAILLKGLEKDPIDRQVRTTLFKAKLVRSMVERMVTYAKKGDLSARRQAARFIMEPAVVQGLFDVIGPRYASREGGYTRVLKLGSNRAGDASEMALIGLVEDEIREKAGNKTVEKKVPKKVDVVAPSVEG